MRSLRIDLQKIVFSPFFIGSMIAVSLLCLTAVCFIDPETGHYYSVVEVMVLCKFGKLDVFSKNLYAEKLICCGLGEWFIMFAPVILGLGSVSVAFIEKRSGYRLFGIIRTSKMRYAFSKLLSCLITSGLGCLLGFALYGALVSLLMPHLKNMPEDYMSFIYQIEYPHGIAKELILVYVAVLLYGIEISLLPLIFSELFKSLYTVLGCAFLIKYLWDTAYRGFLDKGIIPIGNISSYLLDIDSLTYFYKLEQNSLYVLLMHILLILTGSAIYIRLVMFKGAAIEKNLD